LKFETLAEDKEIETLAENGDTDRDQELRKEEEPIWPSQWNIKFFLMLSQNQKTDCILYLSPEQ